MVTKKAAVKSEAKSKGILTAKIQFVFCAPEAQKVSLGGSFNNWDTLAHPMKNDKKGIWKVTVNLKQGDMNTVFLSMENGRTTLPALNAS